MSLRTLCDDLQEFGFALAIRESPWLFPTIETIHVLALVLVIGSIMMVDCRLLGIAHRQRSVTRLAGEALPLTWCAFAVAAVAGILLFSSKAATYYDNWPFRIKMLCLALAGLNMLWFQLRIYPHVAEWDHGDVPFAARAAGGVSLCLWVIVVAAGRWIGFTT